MPTPADFQLRVEMGRRLHEEQIPLGISTPDLAERLGGSHTYKHINNLRRGKCGLYACFLARLAPFGFDVLYILIGKRQVSA